MTKRPTHFRFPVEELVNALIDELERRGVITLEDVLRTAEAWRQRRTAETAAAFMEAAGVEPEKPTPPPPPTLKVEPAPPRPAKSGAENRKARRSNLKLPVRIRAHLPEFEFTEITETVNVSRSGVYFFSDKPYQWQRDVRVVVPYDRREDAQNIESPATIVRIDQKAGQPMRGIALHMSHLFFKLT